MSHDECCPVEIYGCQSPPLGTDTRSSSTQREKRELSISFSSVHALCDELHFAHLWCLTTLILQDWLCHSGDLPLVVVTLAIFARHFQMKFLSFYYFFKKKKKITDLTGNMKCQQNGRCFFLCWRFVSKKSRLHICMIDSKRTKEQTCAWSFSFVSMGSVPYFTAVTSRTRASSTGLLGLFHERLLFSFFLSFFLSFRPRSQKTKN